MEADKTMGPRLSRKMALEFIIQLPGLAPAVKEQYTQYFQGWHRGYQYGVQAAADIAQLTEDGDFFKERQKWPV